MRVIEHHMVIAFKKCVRGNLSRYRSGNTMVWREGNTVCISLHNNTIITYDITRPNEYFFDTCGWDSRTTYSRMNSFSHMMGLQLRFYTNKHVPHIMSRGNSKKLYGSFYYGKD